MVPDGITVISAFHTVHAVALAGGETSSTRTS